MTPDDKLRSVSGCAHNFALEDTVDKRNGEPEDSCVRLSDAIEILNEALRLQRVVCYDDMLTHLSEGMNLKDGDCVINAPQPEMD